jgi:mannose-6-phosphate isomerase-like protein (cupin superfamily)
MDIQKYIESGILEMYCLGLLSEEDQAELIQMATLYPEVKAELTAVEAAFENIAASAAIEPDVAIKHRILTSLGFGEADTLSLDALPVIDDDTDLQPWLAILAHLIPDEPTEAFTLNVIRQDDKVQQMLVTSSNDVPEEEHGDLFESLFILKGRCECTIGENIYALGPGDFIEIPLHTRHDIKLVTPWVTAVLQYRFV